MAGPAAVRSHAQPNILVIVTDDHRLAGTMAVMDKTRKWFHTGGELDPGQSVTGGTFYPKAVANTPLCCPARASIFSGMYSHNHGVRSNNDGAQFGTTPDAPMQMRSLQKYLDPTYRTGLVGKYLNGWDTCPQGDPDPPPYFDRFTIFTQYSPFCANDNGTKKQIWQYGTNYAKEKALEFLNTANDPPPEGGPPKPWFLYLAPFAPHAPWVPEGKYATANVMATDVPGIDESGSFFEQDRTDKPFWLRHGEVNGDADGHRRAWKRHLRMLRSVDDTVDAVMRKIRENGEDNDTIAFFTSDNGFMWGDHGGSAKSQPYLAAINVPFYMRAPGIPGGANVTSQRLVGHIDIAPTALAAAGITPTDVKDGESLLDTSNPRKRVFTELDGGIAAMYPHPLPNSTTRVPVRFASVMTDQVHYIETYGVDSSGADPADWPTDRSIVTAREYYDLVNDRHEETNLLGDADPRNDPPTGALSAKVEADATCGSPPGGPEGAPCTSGQIPLEVKITEGPADNPQRTSGYAEADFYFTSSEPTSNFDCMLEGDPGDPADPYNEHGWIPCTSPKRYPTLFDSYNGQDVQYTFRVRAKDPADSSRPVAVTSYTWDVDPDIPDTRIVLKPPKVSTSGTAWFSFTSSNPSSHFMCKLDSEVLFTPCPGPPLAGGSPASFAVSDTAPGVEHVLEVAATYLGTSDPSPARYTWSVDTQPPPLVSLPSRWISPHSRDVAFRFSSPGVAPDVVTRRECKLDGGEWSPCGPRKNYYDLQDGEHSFRVRAFDLAGNVTEADHDTSNATPADPYTWSISNPTTFRATPDTRWPEVTVGTEVRSVISDGCGGWYVGGLFTQVGDEPGISNLAHITNQRVVDTTWKPAVDGRVRALRLSADARTLYVGGSFTTVGTSTRKNLAAVTTPLQKTGTTCESTAGNVVTSWDPAPDAAVNAITFAPPEDGGETKLYVAGAFNAFGPSATPHSKVARVQTAGTGVVDEWSPAVNSDATLNALAVKSGSVYVGGILSSIGSDNRTNLAEITATSPAEATPWNPAPNNIVQSIVFNPTVDEGSFGYLPSVYVGGQFSSIGNPPAARFRAAEINVSDDGTVTPWNPSLITTGSTTGGTFDFTKATLPGVWALPSLSFETVVGGTFVKAGAPSRLVETHRETGAGNTWSPAPNKAVFDLELASAGPPPGQTTSPPPPEILATGGAFDTPRKLLAFYCRSDETTCP